MVRVWVLQYKEGDCPNCSRWEDLAFFEEFETADRCLQERMEDDVPGISWRLASVAVH